MWVTLEIPHPETGQSPRQVRGRVAWIQRPRTVRQLFQVALELELPGNVWGIGFPPEDWTSFGVPSALTTVHVLPIAVQWNPRTKRYQSLDRSYQQFLLESPALSNVRTRLQ